MSEESNSFQGKLPESNEPLVIDCNNVDWSTLVIRSKEEKTNTKLVSTIGHPETTRYRGKFFTIYPSNCDPNIIPNNHVFYSLKNGFYWIPIELFAAYLKDSM